MDFESSFGSRLIKMSLPLVIRLKTSLCLFLFFFLVYFLSFMLFLLMQLPLWLHGLVSMLLLAHFSLIMRRHVLYRHHKSVIRIWCDDQSNWKMQCRDATVKTVTLLQSVVLSRYFVFLAFRAPGSIFPISVPLALDSDCPERLRSLRKRIVNRP